AGLGAATGPAVVGRSSLRALSPVRPGRETPPQQRSPIVFGVAEDPVKLGLVASFARPGGNATGINFLASELIAKRLGLLHDLMPKAIRIAVLINPANATTAETTVRDIPEAARPLGLQIQILNASTSQGSLRHPSARPDRSALRRPRRVLQQPARPIRDARGAS